VDVAVAGKSEGTGTPPPSWPTPEIFGTIKYDFNTLCDRIREVAYLNKGWKYL